MTIPTYKITEDKDLTVLKSSLTGSVFLSVSGDFGGGVVKIGFYNSVGNFIEYTQQFPLPYKDTFQTSVLCGYGGHIVVRLVGSVSPDIEVAVADLKNL